MPKEESLGLDVVGMGAAAWDHFLVVPRFPKPDEKLRAVEEHLCAGGTVATALVALSRWGLSCRLISGFGRDECSNIVIGDLQSEGIDLQYCLRKDDAGCRRSTILVDERNGQRTVISGPHSTPKLDPSLLSPEVLLGARVLHLDTTTDECSIEAATLASSLGLMVTLDAERVTPRVEELLPLCDYVIASREFARSITGEEKLGLMTYALHLRSGRPTIVTAGDDGCEYAAGKVQFHQPAFETTALDSTAAGDVFHAAVIFGLLSAWDIRRVVRFAAWAGAEACRAVGRGGIPTLDAIRNFPADG